MAKRKQNTLEELGERLREFLEDLERAFNPNKQPKPVPVPVPVRTRPKQR